MKIVVLEAGSMGGHVSLNGLKQLGELVVYESTTLEELPERIEDAEILVINSLPMNEKTLAGAKKLKMITITATGIDKFDLDYLHRRGIRVTNMRGYSTLSVAQHTFALLLQLMEQMQYFHQYVQSGSYVNDHSGVYYQKEFHEIAGSTWGIVGLGAIGERVAEIAEAFGAKVIYCSVSGKNKNPKYQQVDLDTLLRTSDIISVHLPARPDTIKLFDEAAFAKMKKNAIFINVGRGALVDEMALAKALREGWIAAAGLDVLEKEPMAADCPLLPLMDGSRLLITPHVAWSSVESHQRSVDEIQYNIEAFLRGEDRNNC